MRVPEHQAEIDTAARQQRRYRLAHATPIAEPISTAPTQVPLAVPPREASRLLSIGQSTLYALLRAGELHSFRIGNSRRISVQSIADYMARQLAARDRMMSGPQPTAAETSTNAAA
jgi:excisionase family DNA binding protein